jgi:glycosyltransferase involved in cell wall biosynthesis
MSDAYFHVVPNHEIIREANGSALVTIATELCSAARRAGTPAYVVSGVDLPHEYEFIQPILEPVNPSSIGILRWSQRLAERARRAITGRAAVQPERILPPSEAPAVVILHNRPWDARAFRTAFPGARVVLYLHNRVLRFVPPWAKRRALREFDAVICVSTYIAQDLEKRAGYLPIPAEVVRSAPPSNRRSDIDGQAGPLRGAVDVLYVGRMTREKGVHVLLKALEAHPEATARLIGGQWFHPMERESRYERRIRLTAERLGRRVQVLGPLPPPEVHLHRQGAKVAVVPSTWREPLGLTVLEGMASPSAVVATRTGGIPELAQGGGVILVRPRSHSQLARAISRLLQDEELRERVAQAGIEESESWTWNANYGRIHSFISRLPLPNHAL